MRFGFQIFVEALIIAWHLHFSYIASIPTLPILIFLFLVAICFQVKVVFKSEEIRLNTRVPGGGVSSLKTKERKQSSRYPIEYYSYFNLTNFRNLICMPISCFSYKTMWSYKQIDLCKNSQNRKYNNTKPNFSIWNYQSPQICVAEK